jgi:hypothetical protein
MPGCTAAAESWAEQTTRPTAETVRNSVTRGNKTVARTITVDREIVGDELDALLTGRQVRSDGVAVWRRAGAIHRDDGPAIEWPDGSGSWWADGAFVRWAASDL